MRHYVEHQEDIADQFEFGLEQFLDLVEAMPRDRQQPMACGSY